jgi:hypothetical protein
LLLLGCSEPEPPGTELSMVSEQGLLDAEVRFSSPIARGENQLFVQLTPHERDGQPRLLAVDATMAAHSHVSHAERIDETDEGFLVQELDLFMTGRWQLSLSLSLADREDTLSFPVDVP